MVSHDHNEAVLGYMVLNQEGPIQLCLQAAQGGAQRWVKLMRPPSLSEVSKCPSLVIQMGILISWQTCLKSFTCESCI